MTTTFRFLFGAEDHQHRLEYANTGPGFEGEPVWRLVGGEPERPFLVSWKGSFYKATHILACQRAYPAHNQREQPRFDGAALYTITQHHPDGPEEVDEAGRYKGRYLYFDAEPGPRFHREDLTKLWGR